MVDGISEETVRSLTTTARELRRELLVRALTGGAEHLGPALSVCDLLAALVFREMKIDRPAPGGDHRDRLVLSMDYAAPALRAALSLRGCPDGEVLDVPSPSEPGPAPRSGGGSHARCAWVAGPGQGLGMGVGMALAARMAQPRFRTYAVLDSDDLAASETWGALQFGGAHRLSDLTVILAQASAGADRPDEPGSDREAITGKLSAFRYHVVEVDGHDFRGLAGGFEEVLATEGRPSVLLVRTTRGKGSEALERVYRRGRGPPTAAELAQAMADLGISPGGAG